MLLDACCQRRFSLPLPDAIISPMSPMIHVMPLFAIFAQRFAGRYDAAMPLMLFAMATIFFATYGHAADI